MPLSPYRVVELSSERTTFCGHLLEQLGADVVAIEPPGGSPVRALGPFYRDVPDPERSLRWWAHNRGKRSAVLDLDTSDGRDHLCSLLDGADVLIEGLRPGALGKLGLTTEVLEQRYPHLIVVSITPFGQDGPKAGWLGEDLVASAASSTLWTWGDGDRPPEAMSAAPQAFVHAGAEGLVGCLSALQQRATSGLGQQVDVSAQASLALCTQGHPLSGAWGALGLARHGSDLKLGEMEIRMVYPCKDGHVSTAIFFGPTIGPRVNALFRLMHQLGFTEDWMLEKDFVTYMVDYAAGKETLEEFNLLQDALGAYCLAFTKEELYDHAKEHGLLQAPLNTGADLATDDQLNAREFWVDIEHPEPGGCIRYPGAFAQFSETPIGSRKRAPLLGEHTAEVLAEARPSVKLARSGDPERLPLEGLKVLDLTWALVGPNAIRSLADMGATVVKVESANKPDPIRAGPPFRHNKPGLDRCAAFSNFNAGKRSVSLDMRKDGAREVLRELIEWADVVAEAFTPGVMNSWGLDYDGVRAINPSVVMLRTCLNGQTGPEANLGGFGGQGSARAGYTSLLGWPDRHPSLPGAFSDYTATKLVTASILAAVDHRRRTGVGQMIDLSQVEASIPYIAHVALEATANGRSLERAGNRHPRIAPHGVYPVRGEDAWIAIEAHDEAQFKSLARALGQESLARDPRFHSVENRKQNEDELNAQIADATAKFDRDELEDLLQNAGVPAHGVVETTECWKEPQLVARGHFVEVDSAETRPCIIERWRFRLARTPGGPGRVPGVGEHNDWLLRDTLKLSADRIKELETEGALT